MVLTLKIFDDFELVVVSNRILNSFEEWMEYKKLVECIVDRMKWLVFEVLHAL